MHCETQLRKTTETTALAVPFFPAILCRIIAEYSIDLYEVLSCFYAGKVPDKFYMSMTGSRLARTCRVSLAMSVYDAICSLDPNERYGGEYNLFSIMSPWSATVKLATIERKQLVAADWAALFIKYVLPYGGNTLVIQRSREEVPSQKRKRDE